MERDLWLAQTAAFCEEVFAIDAETATQLLEEKFPNTVHGNSDRKRFDTLVAVFADYCREFKEVTDVKLKRKAGQVLLKKLDYSQFDIESCEWTYRRLKPSFEQMRERGVNVYKMIYVQVLTDACMQHIPQSSAKPTIYLREYDPTRDFEWVYQALTLDLKFSQEEVVEMFEKCSSLLVKTNPAKIRAVFDALHDQIWSVECRRVFSKEEVKQILKINPTLLCTNPETVRAAYGYISQKIRAYVNENISTLPRLSQNADYNRAENHTKHMRTTIKNNSSLLTLNSKTMQNKEAIIRRALGDNYGDLFNKIFCEPINLGIIEQIPESRFANAAANIKTLEALVGQEKTRAYLQDNLLMLAFDKNKFLTLLASFNGNLDKLLYAGKAAFAGGIDFKVEDVVSRISNISAIQKINVDDLNGLVCVGKFIDIFLDGDQEMKEKIATLLAERNLRNLADFETRLRRKIREVGREIREMGKLDCVQTLKMNGDALVRIGDHLQQIQDWRLMMSGEDSIYGAKRKEIKTSADIEETLDALRDAYNKKRHKMEKVYDGTAQLFEKTMAFLDESFDDKKAIPQLFAEEISIPFLGLVCENFPFEKKPQLTVFGDTTIEVDVCNPYLRHKVARVCELILYAAEDKNVINIEIQK